MNVECQKNFNIKNLTTFKTGGEISSVYFPKNIEEFLTLKYDFKVFGNLSNTIVSTFGYDGNIVLTSKMDKIEIDGEKVRVGCGVKGPKLAQIVAEKGLSGLEFMIGFPGSIGGEVFMNASANSQSISDCIENVTLYSKEKGVFTFSKEEMEFDYRTSICQKKDYIVLEVEFKLQKKDKNEIEQQMQKNLEFRKNHQPSLKLPNCGSIFKNPKNDSAGILLEAIGAKEMFFGGVKVWENHANFIVNYRAGTSFDILNLMFEMQKGVRDKFNIDLKPEILYLGNRSKEEENLCKILYQK